MNIIEEEDVPYGELSQAQKRARADQKSQERQAAAARGVNVIEDKYAIIGRVDPNGRPYLPPPNNQRNVVEYGGKKRRTRRSKRKLNKRRKRTHKRR